MKLLMISAVVAAMAVQNGFAIPLASDTANAAKTEWHQPKGKAYHYSVTPKGAVTVVSATDRRKVIWKNKFTKFVRDFDSVHVVADGNRIVCVKGNHRITKLTDIVVESITKDGKRTSVKASEFIDKLQPAGHRIVQKNGTIRYIRTSEDPLMRWMKSVRTVDAKGITVVNAKGEAKTLSWK